MSQGDEEAAEQGDALGNEGQCDGGDAHAKNYREMSFCGQRGREDSGNSKNKRHKERQ